MTPGLLVGRLASTPALYQEPVAGWGRHTAPTSTYFSEYANGYDAAGVWGPPAVSSRREGVGDPPTGNIVLLPMISTQNGAQAEKCDLAESAEVCTQVYLYPKRVNRRRSNHYSIFVRVSKHALSPGLI
jgi:hypothetical protein